MIKTDIKNKSPNKSKLSDFSEYILWSQKDKNKYNLHYRQVFV